MRSCTLALLLVALAACRSSPRAPKMGDGPDGELKSWSMPVGAGESRPPVRCLHVLNHGWKTAELWVDGKYVGRVGPYSAAAYNVGRSAGPTTKLRAVAGDDAWEAELTGPPWELAWHLEPK